MESALHAAAPAVTVGETCRAAGAACALGPMLHESKMASAASVVVSDEDMVDDSDLDADGQLDNFKRVRLGYSPYLCYVKDVVSGEFLSFSYNFSSSMPVQVNDEFEVYGDFCNLRINKLSFNIK